MELLNIPWVWIAVVLVCLWALGFVSGRFGRAWQQTKYPEVGTLFIDGKEVWVNFDKIENISELTKYPAVTVRVSAKKPSPKTE